MFHIYSGHSIEEKVKKMLIEAETMSAEKKSYVVGNKVVGKKRWRKKRTVKIGHEKSHNHLDLLSVRFNRGKDFDARCRHKNHFTT